MIHANIVNTVGESLSYSLSYNISEIDTYERMCLTYEGENSLLYSLDNYLHEYWMIKAL